MQFIELMYVSKVHLMKNNILQI